MRKNVTVTREITMLSAEEKQTMLNCYFEARRVLQWAKDNDMLKPSEGNKSPSELAELYAASSREERDWLKEQIGDR